MIYISILNRRIAYHSILTVMNWGGTWWGPGDGFVDPAARCCAPPLATARDKAGAE